MSTSLEDTPRIVWERDGIGAISRYWQTSKNIVLEPTSTFKSFPKGNSSTPAIYYAMLSVLFSVIVVGTGSLIHSWAVSGSYSSHILSRSWRPLIAAIFLAPVLCAFIVGAHASIVHVILGLFGVRKESFDETLRAICYVDGAHAIFALGFLIPQLAPFILLLLILSRLNCLVKGFAELHNCPRKDSFFAFITVFLIFGAYPLIVSFIGGRHFQLGKLFGFRQALGFF